MKALPLPPPWDALGMTASEIALALNIPRQTLYNWLRGLRRPGTASQEWINLMFRTHGITPPTFNPSVPDDGEWQAMCARVRELEAEISRRDINDANRRDALLDHLF